MKKPALAALLLAVAAVVLFKLPPERAPADTAPVSSVQSAVRAGQVDAGADIIARAFAEGRSNVQAAGRGRVKRTLPDDNKGSRHQRFILTLDNGHTVLVAHNIDLAPRIPRLQRGDEVAFYGEYEYNPQGGVIHWTHRDPAGRHAHGWLEHQGQRYQ